MGILDLGINKFLVLRSLYIKVGGEDSIVVNFSRMLGMVCGEEFEGRVR